MTSEGQHGGVRLQRSLFDRLNDLKQHALETYDRGKRPKAFRDFREDFIAVVTQDSARIDLADHALHAFLRPTSATREEFERNMDLAIDHVTSGMS